MTVDDLVLFVSKLTNDGATFRNDIISGKFGQTILAADPSGNPVEVVQRPSG